jgi:hypothetical protein
LWKWRRRWRRRRRREEEERDEEEETFPIASDRFSNTGSEVVLFLVSVDGREEALLHLVRSEELVPALPRHRHPPRVRSHYRFKNRGTEYIRESGMERMSGGAKRQCDRALHPPPPRRLGNLVGDRLAVEPLHPQPALGHQRLDVLGVEQRVLGDRVLVQPDQQLPVAP